MMNLSFATTGISPDVRMELLLPELILSVTGVLVMLVDAFTRKRTQRWATGGLSLAGIAAAAVSCIWLWSPGAGLPSSAFNGMIVLDPMRLSFTLVFLIVAALTAPVSVVWCEE